MVTAIHVLWKQAEHKEKTLHINFRSIYFAWALAKHDLLAKTHSPPLVESQCRISSILLFKKVADW